MPASISANFLLLFRNTAPRTTSFGWLRWGFYPPSTVNCEPKRLCSFVSLGEQPRKGSGRSQASHEEDGPAHGDPPAITASAFSSLPRALLSRTPHLPVPCQPCPVLPVVLLFSAGLHFDGHTHVSAFISSRCTPTARCRAPQRRSQTARPPGGMSSFTQLAFTLQFIRPSFSTHSHGDSLPVLARRLATSVPAQR